MAAPNLKLESYDQPPYLISNPPRDFMRQQDRNATLNDVTTYIYQSLLDYQSKWYSDTRGSNYINLPNARYLAVGDKIQNTTTNQMYLIAELMDKSGYVPSPSGKNIIRLNLQGGSAPKSGDLLALDQKNVVNFETAYSRAYLEIPLDGWRDTVIYRVKRREPGTVGHHPFDPPTEIKPRHRQEIVDPDHPECHILITGQWFDNLIQFDCWSKYNNRADELIEWFENFLFLYTWVWKKNGVSEILYWMRTQDEEVSRWRNDLAVRSLLYYFKTEKLVTIREYDFRQIDMCLSLSNAFPSGFYGVIPEETPAPSGYIEINDKGFTIN